MKGLFSPVIGVLLTFAAVCSASPVWETDWNRALEKAGKSGRPVLVDFTGSDWCPGCIHLRKNIFDTEAFAKYATDHRFILVELDFPRTPGKMPPEQFRLHQNLMRRYGVTSFPTVLLMEGDGSPYAKVKGAARDKEEYLQKLDAAGKRRMNLKEALEAARRLEGNEKLEKLMEALKLLPEDLQPYQRKLIEEIISADPEDKYGFAKREQAARILAQQRLMMQQFYEKHGSVVASRNLDKGREEALNMLKRKDILPSIRLEIAKYVSDTYAMERNYPQTLEYLKLARDSDPESKKAKNLERWIEKVKDIMND